MKELTNLFYETFGQKVETIEVIHAHSSERKIHRLISAKYNCVGITNKQVEENIAFLQFSIAFKSINLKVPLIYSYSKNLKNYLEEDLGNTTLYKHLVNTKTTNIQSELTIYKQALRDLLNFQIEGDKVIDYQYCYQTNLFNNNQIEYDLQKFNNYFSTSFLKLKYSIRYMRDLNNLFNEYIREENKFYFMYRDFQPRNIMINKRKLYYIDYQSGRKGPLQYDLSSFLYSGSIDITRKQRQELLKYYISILSEKIKINKVHFTSNFYIISILRLLQMLGSYGFNYSLSKKEIYIRKALKAFDSLEEIVSEIENKFLTQFIENLLSGRQKITHILKHR
jgi:aminoglycoside/choline kinase family phosphotransferase